MSATQRAFLGAVSWFCLGLGFGLSVASGAGIHWWQWMILGLMMFISVLVRLPVPEVSE